MGIIVLGTFDSPVLLFPFCLSYTEFDGSLGCLGWVGVFVYR